jgi:nitrogen fixation NifU-like protein
MADVETHQRLYRDIVLEHARAPRHAAALPPPCLQAEACNALCGDRVAISVALDADGRIAAIGHASEGCVLCVASASLMCGRVLGADRDALVRVLAALHPLLLGDVDLDSDGELGDLAAFAGVAAYPSRRSCVLLAWDALLQAWPADAPRA